MSIRKQAPDISNYNYKQSSNPYITMPDTPRGGGFDLGAIRSILEQDANKYLKGVCNRDVDWFLRDSHIDPSQPDLTSKSTKSPTAATSNGVETTDADGSSGNVSPTKSGSVPESTQSKLNPVSSHLQTSISNTNDNFTTKTKPSVAPIQEESVSPVHEATSSAIRRVRSASNPSTGTKIVLDNGNSSNRRRLSSATSLSSSIGSNGSGSGSGGGFFSKLKGKFHKTAEELLISPTTSPMSTSPPPSKVTSNNLFKEDYSFGNHSSKPSNGIDSNGLTRSSTISAKTRTPSREKSDGGGLNLTRTMSTPNYSENTSDPRLDEYIKFYQQKSLKRNSGSRNDSFSGHGSTTSVPMNAIPGHPHDSPLPSALLNGYENVTYNRNNLASTSPSSGAAKITSFLKRKSISQNTPSLPLVQIATEHNRRSSESTYSINSTASPPTPTNSDVLPEFADVKPLRRVAFHSSTFLIDPPQQIPSRKPRKGNVEILPNGKLKIHPLSEEEKVALEKSQVGQGGGIVVGGSGSLGLVKKDASDEKINIQSIDDDDTKVDKHAKSLAIDKPMISHHAHNYTAPAQKMQLDLMYTRCCHLREILPIPAILKQIPAGSMSPIPILQLRNPTPTMVEIQTFADFIRIAPIICVSLDGVSLSYDQFKEVLSAMSAKKQLEKLSLRNTPIDQEGWSLLCWFLSRNTVFNKLDITQCPSLSVNLLKKKKKKSATEVKEEELVRMSCNKENRSDMDWGLFTASIIARGGIDELILSGCCISDSHVFEQLVRLAMSIRTSRLGLAYNKLSVKQVMTLVDCWLFQPFARGLDLGYNDFSSLQFLNVLLEKRKDPKFDELVKNSNLGFFSLNATNLRFSETFKEFFETILLRFPNLKYLDMSNNGKLFGTSVAPTNSVTATKNTVDPDTSIASISSSSSSLSTSTTNFNQDAIVSYFTSKLPLFPKLIRLHLENNNLSGNSIIAIARTLPFCKNLGYFSVHGNEIDLTSASALLQALENSKTLITLDCDYEQFPSLFKEKIGLYTMRNMERLLYASTRKSGGSRKSGDSKSIPMPSELVEDQQEPQDQPASLTEQLNAILAKKADDKLDLNAPDVQRFIAKARKIRHDLRGSMNELYKLQLSNELNLEGKEMLIRFVFIESSIEKGLQLIDNSLVDPKDSYSATECMRNSAEDTRNAHLLGPRHPQNETELSPNVRIAPSKSPLSLSRTSSKSNLASMDRNEGSVLKLKKIHENLQSAADDNPQRNKFLKDFSELSGEEIRKNLSIADLGELDKIIDYLGDLKDHNISLGSVFNQEASGSKSSQDEDIHTKLNHLQKTLNDLANQRAGLEAGNDETVSDSQSESANEIQNDSEVVDGDKLSATYDQILNDLERRRIG
ncbi:MAP-homologous protein 1 [[Candida] anglica]|uniref:MAP-homologous protein 1 n=1 Tax=[Candida] anglica TaxID=148631 RepID=A0ABP0EH73_9ASCO